MSRKPLPDDRHPPSLAPIFEALRARAWDSVEEAQAFLLGAMEEYNTAPQADLGGLSPVEVETLLSGDWRTSGPLRLSPDVEFEELRGSRFLAAARFLLERLRCAGPIKSTQAGFLPRAVVQRFVAEGTMPAEWLEVVGPDVSHLNERDLRALHYPRIILELAGLVRRRRGRFHLTRRGRELLEVWRTGELFALLFETYFRKLDLAYTDMAPEFPEFQHLIGVALVGLATVARDWVTPKRVQAEAIHPALVVPAGHLPYDPVLVMVETRLLLPLVEFGLLEQRYLPGEDSWVRPWEVRKTPLYDRLLRRPDPGPVSRGRLRLL